MAKKKLPVSIFELVWYPICIAVMLWGLTYVVLGLVNQFNDFSSLKDFCADFKGNFKLDIYFWGLIIFAIGVVAGVVVALFFAKTFDKAADREQRRSARLNALKKEEKVVDSQEATFTNDQAPQEETPAEEPKAEEPQPEEAPAEQPVEEAKAEGEPKAEEAPAEEKAE